jgi:hypothetical protein
VILAFLLTPLMVGSLAYSLIKWREGRDRAVYYRRTGRIPF